MTETRIKQIRIPLRLVAEFFKEVPARRTTSFPEDGQVIHVYTEDKDVVFLVVSKSFEPVENEFAIPRLYPTFTIHYPKEQ